MKARLAVDALAQHRADAPRAPEQPPGARDVEEGLVDAQLLDVGRDLAEDLHDPSRVVGVALEVRLENDRVRATPEGDGHGHRELTP